MDRSKGPSLASPGHQPAHAAPAPAPGPPKMRKKLQKIKRPASAEVSMNSSITTINKLETPPKISLPLPPDLTDSKWSDYIRSSGYLCASLDAVPQQNALKPSVTIIPELSHLSPDHATPRSSVDTLGSESTGKSAVSVRRRAKTPVHHIGELEARARFRKMQEANRRAAEMTEQVEAHKKQAGTQPLPFRKSDFVSKPFFGQETKVTEIVVRDDSSVQAVPKEASVEVVRSREVVTPQGGVHLIAESYKALIGRGESIFAEEPHTEPPPASRPEESEGALTLRRQRRLGDLRRESQEFDFAAAETPQGSPTSDGTLVAFEEETVYFKPEFPPESPSRMYSHSSPMPSSPLPTPSNIGLKICVDLLAKDITSAVTNNERTPPAEASALQIYTMIEGYERLRDRIVHSGLPYDEALSLEQTLDTWLKALYAAHDRLTGEDQASESEYGDLERGTGGFALD